MFPNPNSTPTSIDCLALANTGVDALVPLIAGLAILAFGIAFFFFARGRVRKSGLALGLVLLLVGGGAGLALTAPASSASADDCTPRDYAIEGIGPVTETVTTGTPVSIAFRVTNAADRDGTTPIVVTIPKSVHIIGATLNASSVNWTLNAADPTNYVFTYTGALPKGTMSGFAELDFTAVNGNSPDAVLQIAATIVTGSGGDTVTSNNTKVFNLTVTTPRDYAIDGSIDADGAVDSGTPVTVSFSLQNVLSRDGTTPIVVTIPKSNTMSAVTLNASSLGWALDSSDPTNYLFTYTGSLLVGTFSTVAEVNFTATTNATGDYPIIVTIVTGSGGDTVTSNNTAEFPLTIIKPVG